MLLNIAYVIAGLLLVFFIYELFFTKKPIFKSLVVFITGILSLAAFTYILSTKINENFDESRYNGQPRSVSCMFNNPVVGAKTFTSDVAKYAAMCKEDYEKKYGDSLVIHPSFEYSFIESGAYLDVTFDVIELNNNKK